MMAVEAGGPYRANNNNVAIPQDFRDRSNKTTTTSLEDHHLLLLHMQQHFGTTTTALHAAGALLGAAQQFPQQLLNFNSGGTVFSSDPQSELTCNGSPSRRKRSRDADAAMIMIPKTMIPIPNPAPRFLPKQSNNSNTEQMASMANNNDFIMFSQEQRRMLESVATSTSDRRPLPSEISSSPVAVFPVPLDVASCMYHQNNEIDALLRLQNEKLRAGFEEARKRHCRALLSAVEQRSAKRMKEKEVELEKATRRNSELEAMVRQLSAEGHMWLNAARESETLVANLRSTLEHVLLQNAAQLKEGCGENDGFAALGVQADDAQSCCFDGDDGKEVEEHCGRQRKKGWCCCRVCGEKEVCVLLLPCKHLCLCKDCESKLDTCPICSSPKKASLQVFMT